MTNASIEDVPISALVDNLVAEVAEAGRSRPSLARMAESSLRAIEASAGRAALAHGRLPVAARTSIASATASMAAAMAAEGLDGEKLRRMAGYVRTFAPIAPPDHETCPGAAAPEGWSGSDGGPFRRAGAGTEILLVKRPCLPGGEWSACYANIPMCYGRTPAEAAAEMETFLAAAGPARPFAA